MAHTIAYVGPYSFDSVMVDKTIHLVLRDLRESLLPEDRVILLTGSVTDPEVTGALSRYRIELAPTHHTRPYGWRRVLLWHAGRKLVARESVQTLTNLWGGFSYGFDAVVIAKTTGKRCVVRIAGNEILTRRHLGCYRGLRGKLVLAADQIRQWLTINLADRILVMSPWEEARVKRLAWNSSKVIICPRGVDIERFPATKLRRDDRELRVLYVGRRSAEKGFDLVEATAKLLERTHPNIKFLFAGGFDASIAGNCRYLGFVKPDDLPRLYDSVDCLLLPSRTEGFPQVVGEAMAKGRPCIVSRHLFDGYLEDRREALLCDLSPEDIANQIVFLHDQPESAAEIGRAAREFAVEKLNQEHWCQVYCQTLTQMNSKAA